MHVREKHHVAWRFPILNPVGNNLFMPVDCCYLPSIVHDIDPLKGDSNDDDVDNLDDDINDNDVNDDNVKADE